MLGRDLAQMFKGTSFLGNSVLGVNFNYKFKFVALLNQLLQWLLVGQLAADMFCTLFVI